MRVYEIVAEVSRPTSRVIDATAGLLTGALRLTAEDAGEVTAAQPGDVVVLAVGDLETDTLMATLREVPQDVQTVLFLPCTPSTLPVGRVVDAVLGADLQVARAVPIERSKFGVAVVAMRVDGLLPMHPYLVAREPIALVEPAIRRLAAEHAVGGLAMRALLDGEIGSTDRVAELERKLAKTRRRLAEIEGSRSYAVGRALAEVRHSPLQGLRGLRKARAPRP